jgi:cell division protein FtsI/penicillin-binding protein 2
MIGKIAAVVVIVVVITVGLVKGGGSSAEPTVQAFLLAWESGQYQTAAAMTTGRPPEVASALAGAYRQLDAANLVISMNRITQHGGEASASFYASVDLGSGGLRWGYQGAFAMRRTSAGWKVLWSPSVIVPGLQSGDRLAVRTTMPGRAQLQDSAGNPLTLRSLVYAVGVRPGTLTHPEQTADALAAVTGLDAGQIYGQIIAAPSKTFLALIRLQRGSYLRLRSQFARVPGLIVAHRRERLFDSIAPAVAGSVGTETALVLRQDGEPYRPGTTVGMSGLQAAYQHSLTGLPTTEVVLQNPLGRQVAVLERWPGSQGKPVRTTINRRVQTAADHALARLPDSAAIVAIAPGTGRILAVAAHQAAGMPPVSPLTGHYEPGQAFTIVSTAALLTSSDFDVATRIPCKTENTVGNQLFRNQPAEVGLGSEPPFSVDFAHACGTAFAGLSLQLKAGDLASAARKFGIGANWQLKVDSYSGTLGNPIGYGQIAAAFVGDGGVRVSPLDMALAAGLVRSGSWHSPTLVVPAPDPPPAPSDQLSPQVILSLRSLMRTTVTKGAGRAARAPGGNVYGQIGNSVMSSTGKGLRDAWFVGYQGNIAFAVLEFAKSPNVSAAPLAGTFLRDFRG